MHAAYYTQHERKKNSCDGGLYYQGTCERGITYTHSTPYGDCGLFAFYTIRTELIPFQPGGDAVSRTALTSLNSSRKRIRIKRSRSVLSL